jgi:hypothetical protein
MSMNVTRLISLFIFLYTLGCSEEETIPRTYPVVNTLETTEITPAGAVFNAEITSGSLTDIIEHGFVWSADKNNPVTLETGDLVKLGKPESQLIAAKINSTLENSKEYLVRSYIQTSDKIIYGKIVKFFSLGSFGPTLLNAFPLEARVRDTVMLYGNNFSYRVADNIVKFENFESKVLDATDTSLKVVVPDMINTVQPIVTLDIKSNRTKLNKIFTIKPPEIYSVSPNVIKLCDTIFIRGHNFFPVKEGNRVLLGGLEARITEVISREVIKVLAPKAAGKLEDIELLSGGFEVNSLINLNQVVPEVIGEAVFENSILTINGNNFRFCDLNMTIQLIGCDINGCLTYYPEVVLFTDSKIQLKSPAFTQCFPPMFDLYFVSGFDFSYKIEDINYNSAQVLSVSKSSVAFLEEVVINVKNFFDGSLNTLSITIGGEQSRIINKSETQIVCEVPPGAKVNSNGFMDVKVYSCGNIFTLNDVLRLKPPIISDFNPKEINSRSDQIIISGNYFNPQYSEVRVGDKLLRDFFIQYSETQIALGSADEIIGDLYLTQKASYPLSVTAGGQTATSSVPLTLNYQGMWTSQQDLTFTGREGAASFSLNGKGYVVSGNGQSGLLKDVWQFDPLNNTWSKKADFPGAGRRNATVMILNNTAYVGLGDNANSGYYKDWYEYNPDSDSWIKRADFPGNTSTGSFAIGNLGICGRRL